MSRQGAIRAMALLTAAFPKELPEATIKLYVASLQDLPEDALLAVAEDAVRTSRWWPTVAELRETTLRLVRPEAFPPLPEAAWQEVLEAARTVGKYGRPAFSHPAISEALEAVGGYWEACMTGRPEAMGRRFVATYQQSRNTAIRDALRQPNSGTLSLHETESALALNASQTNRNPEPEYADQEDVEETTEADG